MSPTISTLHLDPGQKARFQQLTQAPKVAWVTVMMCIALAIGLIGADLLALAGVMPLWAGMLSNSVVGYLAFSVVHDSIHRSISSHQPLNDWVGRAAVLLVVPYVNLGLFRWAHIQHHRFASGVKDPDLVFQGPWWQLPFRWACIDALYLVHVIRHGDKVSRPFFRKTLLAVAVVASIVIALTVAGYGLEVLMLWFIPTRLIQMALGFSFFWLPHAPHDTPQADNFTRASAIREGHEWLLDPLLQYQNYHLIHHLYPSTPFYNNGKVWRLMEPALRGHDLAIQKGFAIKPEIHLASQRPGGDDPAARLQHA